MPCSPMVAALRASEGAGLDDVELAAVGIDADAEAGEVAIPEDGVLAVDRETVHDSLGEGVALGPGHGGVLLGKCYGRRGDSVGLSGKRIGSAVLV